MYFVIVNWSFSLKTVILLPNFSGKCIVSNRINRFKWNEFSKEIDNFWIYYFLCSSHVRIGLSVDIFRIVWIVRNRIWSVVHISMCLILVETQFRWYTMWWQQNRTQKQCNNNGTWCDSNNRTMKTKIESHCVCITKAKQNKIMKIYKEIKSLSFIWQCVETTE